jgi:hypothetical protein
VRERRNWFIERIADSHPNVADSYRATLVSYEKFAKGFANRHSS